MALRRRKRGREHTSPMMNNEKMAKKMKNVTEDETTEMVSGFPVLELPIHILYDIISRLPLETIFSCKCVCRVFLNIIKDPFFAKIHLTKAPSTSAALIVQEDQLPFGNFHPYMLDLDDTPARSSCSSDHHPCHQHFLSWQIHGLTQRNVNCCFFKETEKFRSVPVPAHFGPEYVSKISWISVGVLGERLCVCYTLGDAQFEVCVMKEYGVRESWIKEFVIDVKFYCGVQVEDLQQPIKFSNNGELLLISRFNFLVSYSPQKGTFREIKKLGDWKAEAIAHVPSLISLKTAVKGKNLKVEKIKLERPMQI